MIRILLDDRRAARTPNAMPNPLTALVARSLLAAAGACVALAGHAADKPREASFGTAKPGGKLLTPAELRNCLAQQDKLRATTDDMTKQQSALAADKAEIDRLGVALKDQSAALDRTSADAVAAYNAQVDTRDKMIDAYQDGVPAFNTKAEALKSDQAAFAKACENRRYDEADEQQIRKGK